jgi:hypothetical protein
MQARVSDAEVWACVASDQRVKAQCIVKMRPHTEPADSDLLEHYKDETKLAVRDNRSSEVAPAAAAAAAAAAAGPEGVEAHSVEVKNKLSVDETRYTVTICGLRAVRLPHVTPISPVKPLKAPCRVRRKWL